MNNCMDDDSMQSNNYNQNMVWKDALYKAGLTAGVAGIASMFLFNDGRINVMGTYMPVAVPVALGAATGSLVGDLAHSYIIPHIPVAQKYQAIESAAVSVGAAGAGTYLAANLFQNANPLVMVAVGGGSYIAGEYLEKYMKQSKMLY